MTSKIEECELWVLERILGGTLRKSRVRLCSNQLVSCYVWRLPWLLFLSWNYLNNHSKCSPFLNHLGGIFNNLSFLSNRPKSRKTKNNLMFSAKCTVCSKIYLKTHNNFNILRRWMKQVWNYPNKKQVISSAFYSANNFFYIFHSVHIL